MKWKLVLVAGMIIMLLSAGCSQAQPNSSQPVIPQPASPADAPVKDISPAARDIPSAAEDVPSAAASVKVLRNVYTKTFKDEDGTVLMELKITSPELLNPGNEKSFESINLSFNKLTAEFISLVESEGLKKARDNKAEMTKAGFPFYPHAYDRNFQITYNGNGLLSVISEQYENTGGAHPNTLWLSQTFDLTTGKKLGLQDFLGGSREQALEKVYGFVLSQIKQKEGTDQFVLSEGYQQDIRKYYDEEDYILDDKSLTIYYQLYAIAPYAAGAQHFKIPYDQKTLFARTIPAQPSNELERELYTQANLLLDRNKVIFYEICGLSMLKLTIPEQGAGTETIFPVDDERFTTYKDLEDYIRFTYAKSEADQLLNSGRYLNKNGKLYGDITKDGSMGYYVDWNHYSLEISDMTDRSARLNVYTVDESPAGKEKKLITVNMLKVNDIWVLDKMVY